MATRSKRNGKIDEQIEETFPASDPPSFMGGEILGAPKGRRTVARKPATSKSSRKAKAAKRKTKIKRPAKKKQAKKRKRATKKRSRR
ncbi:MAG TPA: hypothetical protein VG867_03480 [Rhizomicrobium sp.]|nr:hypothetical protein [Rhizomicrobium sp.]